MRISDWSSDVCSSDLGAAAGSSAGASAGSAPPPPITARTAPTSTVSPSATLISVSVPLVGDGTSESTLSVDTSKSGSSSATESPTALNHLVIVPSVTVSPSWGIVMSAIGGSGSLGAGGLSVQRATGEADHGLAEHLAHRGVGLEDRKSTRLNSSH